MDKKRLHRLILKALQSRYDTALAAAQQAYETATHEENVAENKYDTLGLEASYLAEGQSRRVAEAEQELKKFEHLSVRSFDEEDAIQFGALLGLRSLNSHGLTEVFLSPVAGGLSIELEGRQIMLVTDKAPLGKALLGAYLDDEVCPTDQCYLIESLV
jgi:hypothetical protein